MLRARPQRLGLGVVASVPHLGALEATRTRRVVATTSSLGSVVLVADEATTLRLPLNEFARRGILGRAHGTTTVTATMVDAAVTVFG